MPKVSRETASETIALEGLEVQLEHLDGGYSVCFESHTADADLADLFRGLPDDRCQLPRWGYVIKGKVAFRLADREETYEAGDAYYVPPGHTPDPLRGGRDRRVQPDGRPRADDPRGDGQPAGGRSRSEEPGMNYRLAYAIGFHPWEDLAEHPPFAGKLLELVAREEAGREPPYGPALDLGTGSAVWGVQLAKRGWQVTGVDIVEKALRRARERVDEAGVEMRLVRGDVTALRQADVGSGFRLVLDTGTFHGLSDAQRAGDGPRGERDRRPRRHRAARLLRAPAQGAAAARREPRRRRGGLPRMGGDRRRGRGHRARRARTTLQVRRALLPATPQRDHGVSTRCAWR